MGSILAAANAAGVASLFVIGVTVMGFGLAILKDWRGVASNYHRITMRSPMPGIGFYRDFRTFQLIIGTGAIVFGAVALVVATILA